VGLPLSVWFCIPSKRPPDQVEPVLAKWKERGYKTALWRDDGWDMRWGFIADRVCHGEYPGYAQAVNHLTKWILDYDPSCDWIVTGGDDIVPDTNGTAEEISRECISYFSRVAHRKGEGDFSTFGVMQPTGDRWGDSPRSRKEFGENRGAYIDRVCGSPWMGREFCQRIYGGKGPLWPEFTHMYVDEHLQCVAEKLGILWQRRDLIQEHRHWGRTDSQQIPDHLKAVNTPAHFAESKAIFDRLKAGGFAEASL